MFKVLYNFYLIITFYPCCSLISSVDKCFFVVCSSICWFCAFANVTLYFVLHLLLFFWLSEFYILSENISFLELLSPAYHFLFLQPQHYYFIGVICCWVVWFCCSFVSWLCSVIWGKLNLPYLSLCWEKFLISQNTCLSTVMDVSAVTGACTTACCLSMCWHSCVAILRPLILPSSLGVRAGELPPVL